MLLLQQHNAHLWWACRAGLSSRYAQLATTRTLLHNIVVSRSGSSSNSATFLPLVIARPRKVLHMPACQQCIHTATIDNLNSVSNAESQIVHTTTGDVYQQHYCEELVDVFRRFDTEALNMSIDEQCQLFKDLHNLIYKQLNIKYYWVERASLSIAYDVAQFPQIRAYLRSIHEHASINATLSSLTNRISELSDEQVIQMLTSVRCIFLDWRHPASTRFYVEMSKRAPAMSLEDLSDMVPVARIHNDHVLLRVIMSHHKALLAELKESKTRKAMDPEVCNYFARTLLGTHPAISEEFFIQCLSEIIFCLSQQANHEKHCESVAVYARLIHKIQRKTDRNRELVQRFTSLILPICKSNVHNLDLRSLGALSNNAVFKGDLDFVDAMRHAAERHMQRLLADNAVTFDDISQVLTTIPAKDIETPLAQTCFQNMLRLCREYQQQQITNGTVNSPSHLMMSSYLLTRYLELFTFGKVHLDEMMPYLHNLLMKQLPVFSHKRNWQRPATVFLKSHPLNDDAMEVTFITCMLDLLEDPNQFDVINRGFHLSLLLNVVFSRLGRMKRDGSFQSKAAAVTDDLDEVVDVLQTEKDPQDDGGLSEHTETYFERQDRWEEELRLLFPDVSMYQRFKKVYTSVSREVDIFELMNVTSLNLRKIPRSLRADFRQRQHTSEAKISKKMNTMEITSLAELNGLLGQFLVYGDTSVVDSALLGEIVEKYMEFSRTYSSLDVSQIAQVMANLMYHHPVIINNLVDSLLFRVTSPGPYCIHRVLRAASMTGVVPKHLAAFTTMCLDTMEDYYKHKYYTRYLHMLNLLAMLESFPHQHIARVFSLEFLHILDSFLEDNPERRRAVEQMMLQLNRSVVLEFPELNVPWIHDSMLKQREKQRSFRQSNTKHGRSLNKEVLNVLSKVVPKNCYEVDTMSKYLHKIDVLLHLSASGKPMVLNSPKTPHERVALQILTKRDFCLTSHNPLGPVIRNCRQLEIMGYRVIQIPHFEWNSMGWNDLDAKVEYLENKLR